MTGADGTARAGSPRGAGHRPPLGGWLCKSPRPSPVGCGRCAPRRAGGGRAGGGWQRLVPPSGPPRAGRSWRGGRGGAGPGAPGPGGGRQPPFLRAAGGTQTFAPNFYPGFIFVAVRGYFVAVGSLYFIFFFWLLPLFHYNFFFFPFSLPSPGGRRRAEGWGGGALRKPAPRACVSGGAAG